MPDPIQEAQQTVEEVTPERGPVTPAPVWQPSTLFGGSPGARLERLDYLERQTDEDERKQNRSFGRKMYEATLEPAFRGITGAADETSQAILGTGAWINKKLGIYKMFNEEGEQKFLDWYDAGEDRFNPWQFGDEFRDEYLGGPSDTMWEGLLEGGVQFAVGFIGAGKFMGAAKVGRLGLGVAKSSTSVKAALGGGQKFGTLLQTVQAAGWKKAAKEGFKFSLKELVYETARGGVADVLVFDGHEQRLADLMDNYEFLRNPIQQYLVTDMEDSEFEGRMKNLLEGGMLGAQIDLFLGGIRAFRAGTRAVNFAKHGDDIMVKSEVEKWADALETMEKNREAEITSRSKGGLQTVPEGERAAVSLLPDGTAELMVRVTDEERNFMPPGGGATDSGELVGTTGGQRFEAAVRDPGSDFIGRGPTHEQAIDQIARKNLGEGADELAVRAESKRLFDEIPGDLDGFVEKGMDDATYLTRGEMGARFDDELAEGIVRTVFKNPEEAHQVGAALEMLDRARKMQRDSDLKTGMDPETAEMFQKSAVAMEDAWRTGDMDMILRAQSASNINLRPIYNGVQARAAIATISEMFPRRLEPFTDVQLRKATADLFPPEYSHEDVVAAMARTFGNTLDLDRQVLGYRGYLIAAGRETQRTAKLIEGVKPAAKSMHMARLADQMDALLDLTDLVSGIGTNTARGLRAFGVMAGARKLRRGFPGIEEAQDMVKKAEADVEEIAKAGKDTKVVDKALDDALNKLEQIMRETSDEAIEGVRRAEVPTAETLPRGAGEAAGEAAEAAPALTREERIAGLTKRAEELLETEATRESRLRKLEGLESPTAPDQARLSVRNMTHDEIDALARMIFLSDNQNPGEILQQILVPAVRDMANDGRRFLQKPELTGMRKALKAAQWYRVNAMLSGPRTHAINTLSNTMVAISRPIEMAVGGAFYRNLEGRVAANDLMAGLFQNWGDHWRAARKAMKQGQGVLDPKTSHFSGSYAAQQAALQGGDASTMVKLVGKPGTWLMGLDEFASQVNYRAHLRMGLLKQGRRAGKAGDELAEWVERHLAFGYGRDGQGTIKSSIEFARENTFKAELGDAGQAFEKLMNSETVPAEFLQVLMPFRKTPINITKYAWQRMPYINLLSSNFREALSGAAGQAAKEEALGKFVIGNVMYGSAAALYLNGSLTGDGPRDPRMRKLWLEAGNRPGTLRIGDTTIEVRRLDPVLTPLVMVANLLETGSEWDDETNREAAAMLILTMMETVTERSFFSGLTEFFAASTQGNEDLLNRWVSNTAQSMIPNILKQTNVDQYYREANGFIEELRSRTLGLSQGLEARRNVFGEPAMKPVGFGQRAFNPFTMTFGDTVDEKLARELYDIGSTMALPPAKKSFGEGGEINLQVRGKYQSNREGAGNQSPYDRWLELSAGKEINGGRTIKQRIVRLSETQAWKDGDPPIKRRLVEKIIAGSRNAAWHTMLSEFPALQNEVIFRKTMGTVKGVTTNEEDLQQIRNNFGMTEEGRLERLAARLKPRR